MCNIDRRAELKEKFAKIDAKKLPSLAIVVPEAHVGVVIVDPAAQTEIAMLARDLGFTVIDPALGNVGDADVLVTGQGMSETCGRLPGLTAVKGRVELKFVERKTGKVLAVDRQTEVVVDAAELVGGKQAL